MSASQANCTAKGYRKLQPTDDFGDFFDFLEHEQLHGSAVGPVDVAPVDVGFVVVGSVIISKQFNIPVSFK